MNWDIYKNICRPVLLTAVIINISLLGFIASGTFALHPFSIASDNDPITRHVNLLGYDKTDDPAPYIEVPYFLNPNSDWSFTILMEFDDVQPEAINLTGGTFPTDIAMISLLGTGISPLLLHTQFGGQFLPEVRLVSYISPPGSDDPRDAIFESEGSSIQDGQWYWFTVTHNSETNELNHYINGIKQNIIQRTGDIPGTYFDENPESADNNIAIFDTDNETKIWLGVHPGGRVQFLNGRIAQFRAFSEVLTESDVSAWVNQNQRPNRQLEVELLFQGGEDELVEDTSGNNRHATIINFYDEVFGYGGTRLPNSFAWGIESPVPLFVQPRTSSLSRLERLQLLQPPEPIRLDIMVGDMRSIRSNDYLEINWDYNRDINFINIYYSIDDGETWTMLERHLPARARSWPVKLPDLGYSADIMFKVTGTDLAIDFIEAVSDKYLLSHSGELITNLELLRKNPYKIPPRASSGVFTSPKTSQPETVTPVKPGTLIKATDYSHVYLVDEHLRRRPIFAQGIFSPGSELSGQVNLVTNATVYAMEFGDPVLPHRDRPVLFYDQQRDTVYARTDNLYRLSGAVRLSSAELRGILEPVYEGDYLYIPAAFVSSIIRNNPSQNITESIKSIIR